MAHIIFCLATANGITQLIGRFFSLPETNSSHLKMDGWNTTFLLGRPIFRGELLVSGRISQVELDLIHPKFITIAVKNWEKPHNTQDSTLTWPSLWEGPREFRFFVNAGLGDIQGSGQTKVP